MRECSKEAGFHMPPESKVCRNRDCRAQGSVLQFYDRFFLVQWLQWFARDYLNMTSFRDLLRSEGAGGAPHRLSDDDVIERIAELVISGRLHVHGQPVPAQAQGADAAAAGPSNAQKAIDKSKVVDYMDKNTYDTDTYHHQCAKVCHAGLAAGGLGWDKDRPTAAKDNGPWLQTHGAQIVGRSNNTDLPSGYTQQKGDVAVFSGGPTHPIGHMEIYDGKQWVSDTKQTTFSPARTYGGSVIIYRFPD